MTLSLINGRSATTATLVLLLCWAITTTAQPLPTPTADPAARAKASQAAAITQALPLAEEIQVQASTDLTQAIVGQQIVLRVLVIGDGPLPPGRLIPPNLDGIDVLMLGEDRWIDRSTRAGDLDLDLDLDSARDRDGGRSDREISSNDGNDGKNTGSGSGSMRERWIIERRYALFPRSAGRLEIPASVYSAWRPGTDAPEALRSEALSIEVRPAQPRPADVAADSPWLPATALSLSEAGASSVRLAPGQVIERMLTIEAVGLRAEDLPPIRPSIPLQLQVREDAPRLWNKRGPQGVTGYRTERITLSTPEPGLYQLPAVTLDWWNVDTERWERASTPDWQLQVAEFDSSSRRRAPDWRRDGADSAPNTNSGQAPTASVPEQPWVVAHWPWIIGTLGLLLMAWLLGRVFQRAAPRPRPANRDPNPEANPAQTTQSASKEATWSDSAQGSTSAPPPSRRTSNGGTAPAAKPDLEPALSELAAAYQAADAERAKAALLAWGTLYWPEHPPSNLSQLSSRLPGPIAGEILLLDKALLSPSPIDWSAAPVADRLRVFGNESPQTDQGTHAVVASTI